MSPTRRSSNAAFSPASSGAARAPGWPGRVAFAACPGGKALASSARIAAACAFRASSSQ